MHQVDQVVILSFRGLGHYWPVVLRQLSLPPDVEGESLPYRRQFVYQQDVSRIHPGSRAIICLKIDRTESAADTVIYIPLRLGVISAVDTGEESNLVQVFYTTGPTIDYRPHELIAYSDLLRTAIGDATGQPDIGDEALVVTAPILMEQFDSLLENEENDRWFTLTRGLTDGTPLIGKAHRLLEMLSAEGRQRFLDIYPKVMYLRYSRILAGGKPILPDGDLFRLCVDASCELEVLSCLAPLPEFLDRAYPWTLTASNKYFELFNWSAEIGPGFGRHRIPFEARRLTKGTQLRLSPAATPNQTEDPFQFDVYIKIRTSFTRLLSCVLAGIVLSLAVGLVLASGVVDEDWAPAAGAFLLIVGAVGTYWQTSSRSS
jgi:hypothetical protein